MKKLFLTVLAALCFFLLPLSARAVDKNELKQGAEAPEVVYAKYVNAIQDGNISAVKKLLYSRSVLLWDKHGRKMLAMTRNTIPVKLRLLSKKLEKKYQYNYMVLHYIGNSSNGNTLSGEVKMIVEDGVWKLYQEIWNPKR